MIDDLVLDLVEWLSTKERSYEETMAAWRTSCPRLTVWEDANDRGFIRVDGDVVRLTDQGRQLLTTGSRHRSRRDL